MGETQIAASRAKGKIAGNGGVSGGNGVYEWFQGGGR